MTLPDDFLTAGVEFAHGSAKFAIVGHGQGRSIPIATEAVALPVGRDASGLLTAVRGGWGNVLNEVGLVPADIALVGWSGATLPGLEHVRPFYSRLMAEEACRWQPRLATDVVFAPAFGAALLAAARFERASAASNALPAEPRDFRLLRHPTRCARRELAFIIDSPELEPAAAAGRGHSLLRRLTSRLR